MRSMVYVSGAGAGDTLGYIEVGAGNLIAGGVTGMASDQPASGPASLFASCWADGNSALAERAYCGSAASPRIAPAL